MSMKEHPFITSDQDSPNQGMEESLTPLITVDILTVEVYICQPGSK
ncbi:hypothetical protein [Chengkuizengella axinellae]|uniref:Uncharacterized protein n=1 Tax=Chengkuizengella axinellae TaxID=3064388 RepID=A0ABT9IUJ2_9BACL|nr:hypothetical protein [Chengkuizengella sp. 2205SS18-9]MDP5272953.1 hypothetical protein [Chengkuizengella sp. 2205SS18-9]